MNVVNSMKIQRAVMILKASVRGYHQGSQGVDAASYDLNGNRVHTNVREHSTFTDSFQSKRSHH